MPGYTAKGVGPSVRVRAKGKIIPFLVFVNGRHRVVKGKGLGLGPCLVLVNGRHRVVMISILRNERLV